MKGIIVVIMEDDNLLRAHSLVDSSVPLKERQDIINLMVNSIKRFETKKIKIKINAGDEIAPDIEILVKGKPIQTAVKSIELGLVDKKYDLSEETLEGLKLLKVDLK